MVSRGAEVIMLRKKFFLDNADSILRAKLRMNVSKAKLRMNASKSKVKMNASRTKQRMIVSRDAEAEAVS